MFQYLTANTVVELICFIAALLCLATDKSYVWRAMILYLLTTCITELMGIYISGPHKLISNHWLYNIFLLCEGGFTHLMFAHLIGKYTNSKPVIFTGLAIFIGIYIYELTNNYNHHLYIYNIQTFTVMSVLFVLYSLYYYYLQLKDDSYVVLKYSPEFWWVAGTLFFYFTNTACNIFFNQLKTITLWNGYHLTHYIFRLLNIILYSCWSYSFICRKWISKY
ncbi:hypothetical protein BDD43_0428 [Mucilaginibacter gracilis]|uniref:Ceramidase n=1 Tax=Mucilaginibacter gracilis TaxID=423350 RepID=A0A495IVJ7_9SPHI|nr:hypothetical protein [Mucilaginibacter gracilis]RKR80331.1 hypothetical protein BDD43_0428 [Mucilaginibacter gracilis]